MAFRLSPGARNAILDVGWNGTSATTGVFDGGTARINVYTGAQPAAATDAASGTLLGTLTPSSDAFAAAANNAVAMNAVSSDTSADANGTAGYVRFYRTGDTAPGSASVNGTDRRIDLLIGTDIAMDVVNVITGGVIALSGWSVNQPTG